MKKPKKPDLSDVVAKKYFTDKNYDIGKNYAIKEKTMNPDYNPFDYKDHIDKYESRYAGPYSEKEDDVREARRAEVRRQRCRSLVGRVITQKGLVGALVLQYNSNDWSDDDFFKVRLQDGSIVTGEWNHYYSWDNDPSGITSNGWTIGDIKPDEDWDDIPF